MFEDGLGVLVEMDDLFLLGRDQSDIFPGFLVDPLVVDVNVGERVVEQVAEDRGGLAVFGEQQLGGLVAGYLLPGALPLFDEGFEFRDEHRGFLAFGCCPDDGSVILGKNAPHEGLEASPLFLGGDFLGYAHLLGEGEEYNVASCQ